MSETRIMGTEGHGAGGRDAPKSWEREYERLVQRAREHGGLQSFPDDRERRGHPRFQVSAGSIGVQVETRFPVVNVSASGICFRSMFRLSPGQTFNVVLSSAFLVEVSVVACERAEAASGTDEWPWRLHCRFPHPDDGVRLVVLLGAMGSLLEAPPEA